MKIESVAFALILLSFQSVAQTEEADVENEYSKGGMVSGGMMAGGVQGGMASGGMMAGGVQGGMASGGMMAGGVQGGMVSGGMMAGGVQGGMVGGGMAGGMGGYDMSLAGCERDKQEESIKCPDGVYVKSKSINETERFVIKEVEKSSFEKNEKSKAKQK